MKLLVLNGPNLNLLGVREKKLYGQEDYVALCQLLYNEARRLGLEVEIKQTNSEGELVGYIQEALDSCDGIIINPAAYTHYSIAVLDALKAVNLPSVEVHITNIHKREDYRRRSVTAAGCDGQISGLGFKGYVLAMEYLVDIISEK